jgi:hypothetical protein
VSPLRRQHAQSPHGLYGRRRQVGALELVDDRFGQLAVELRSSRPAASVELRERVATLARTEPARPWWSARPPARRLAYVLVAAALLASLVTAGLTGLDRSSGNRQAVVHGQAAQPQTTGAAEARVPPVQSGVQLSRGAFRSDLAPTATRLQQYEATLRLRVKNIEALSNATKRAMTIARALGGYVASVGYSTGSGRRGGATLVLRVPITNVQDALQELTALGTILGQQTGILDVTKRAAREASQLAKLEAELSRIESQLASPGLTATRRAQLERRASEDRLALKTLRAKHRRLLRSARLARIELALTTPAKRAAAAPGRIEQTLDDAGSVLVRELEILVYALVVVGPLLAIGGAGIAFGRAQRRRSDRRLLERT